MMMITIVIRCLEITAGPLGDMLKCDNQSITAYIHASMNTKTCRKKSKAGPCSVIGATRMLKIICPIDREFPS